MRPGNGVLRATLTVALVVGVLLAGLPLPGRALDAEVAVAGGCPPPITGALTATAGVAGTVALTFDDGPHPVYTAQMLDLLRSRGVRGTFFVVGQRVERRPELVARTVREGHRIGNHTHRHPTTAKGGQLDELPRWRREEEMDLATEAILAAAGVTPCVFRAPQGSHNTELTRQLANERGMTVVGWSHSLRDLSQPATLDPALVDRSVADATTPLRPRPIVLAHDGGPDDASRINTVASIDRIIDTYDRLGYVYTDAFGDPLPRLRPRVRLTAPLEGRQGDDLVVRGRSWALRAGTAVRIEVRDDGRWRRVGTTRITTTNDLRLTWIPTRIGHYPLRAVADTGSSTVTSPEIEATIAAGEPLWDLRFSVHADTARQLAAAGAISGYPDGSYRPDAPITRGQFATIVAGTVALHGPGDATFVDVPTTHTHVAAIGHLADAGLMSGHPDGTFRPGDTVTRGQVAAVLTRHLALRSAGPAPFRDVPTTLTHHDAIAAAAAAGLIHGYPDGTFHPNAPVSRGQAATMLVSLLPR